jgi:hypothetical protein
VSPTATVITDEVATVDALADGDRVLIDPGQLPAAIGWQLKDEGLCRDDMCVPVRDREPLFAGERLDLAAVADALGRPIVVDVDAMVAAVALSSEERRRALREHQAPPFTLPDLDGNLHSLEEWRGRKKLLIAFSTW